MRLGIDFGTTRIVAAATDRGNFPVVAFECGDGGSREWVPPVVAVAGERRVYGWDAWHMAGEPGVTVVRSLKRVLADAGPDTLVRLGPQAVPLSGVLTEMLCAFREDLLQRSSVRLPRGEPLEVMLGVPANANSNQRFLTVEGFRSAGFDVLGLLNEPSAASVEYAHRLSEEDHRVPERILVFDLGGGTFDVSLVEREERSHHVLATESIPTLGGDDFDEVLAALALRAANRLDERASLSAAQEFLLAEECRTRKEALHPNTRKVIVDLDAVHDGWGQAALPIADYYAACTPLVEETLHATEDVLSKVSANDSVSLYMTGGGTELPLVARLLKERFGRRVRRSAYTRAATAIGLAIQADAQSGYRLSERFTRWFGVWREADGGRRIVFDPLFEKGCPLPAPGDQPLVRVRTYAPVHNIGHFRYLECSHRDVNGAPVGDLAAWDEIRFPFDPALKDKADLTPQPVTHSDAACRQTIEERYEAGSDGVVTVTISNRTTAYVRNYRLGKWASRPGIVTPHKTLRRRRKSDA